VFGRRRLRLRLGDALSRDGSGRRALSRCAFGRGNRRPLAPTPQHMVSASVAPEPRHVYACILGADGRSRTCVRGRVRRRTALLLYLDSRPSWRQARAVPISLLPVSHHVTLDITACTLTMSSTVVEVTRVGFIGASAGCVRPQPRGLYVQPCWSRSSRPRWTPDLGVLHPPCRMCQQWAIVVMA